MTILGQIQYRIFVVVVIVFFSMLAFFSYDFLRNEHEYHQSKARDEVLSNFTLRVSEKVQHAVEMLRGVSLFVTSDHEVSYEHFRHYTLASVGEQHPWLIIEWQPIVKADDREAFEAEVRRHIFPDFELWELDEKGERIKAKIREEHVPVLFMVSNTHSANTMGLDLAWSQERMESKLLARDHGQAKLSKLFKVVLSSEDNQGPAGFAVTFPVFEDAVIPHDINERRNKIRGYIAGVYSLEHMLSSELKTLSDDGYRLEISDSECPDVCFSWPHHYSDKRIPLRFNKITISLFDRTWHINVQKIHQDTGSTFMKPWIIAPLGIGGFAIGFLLMVRWLHTSNTELKRIESTLEYTLERVRLSESQFAEQAKHDPLTNLLNRRAFFELFEQEIERAGRYEEALALLIIDIDDFKKINDNFGHPVGD